MPSQINGFVKTCAPVFNSLTGSSVETSPTDFIPLVKKTSPSVCTLMATNNTIKVFIIADHLIADWRRGVGSGEWGMGHGSYFPTPHSPLPTPHSPSAIGRVS